MASVGTITLTPAACLAPTSYGGDGPPQPHMQGYGTDVEALEGLRVGVFRPHFDDAPPHMVKAADDAVAWLVAQGAKVCPTSTSGYTHGTR